MTAAEISMKPPNTTLSPYTFLEQKDQPKEPNKRPSESASDSQYWRYDVSQKRQRTGTGDGDKLCFKFIYSDSCPRGEKCHFRHDMDAREQYLRGVCIDFLIKGKCERGPDCKFKHDLQSEVESYSHKRHGSQNSNRSVFDQMVDWSMLCDFCLCSRCLSFLLYLSPAFLSLCVFTIVNPLIVLQVKRVLVLFVKPQRGVTSDH